MLTTAPIMNISAYPQMGEHLVPEHRAPEHPARMSVLVVDEDDAVRDACCEIARKHGFLPHGVPGIMAARELLRGNSIDIVLLDLKGPGTLSLELLDEIKTLHPETAIIVTTAYATVTSAVEAMRTGATDYLTKPFALDELATVLERASERRTLDLASRRLREKLRTQQGLGNIIGRSAEMDKIYRILSKVAFTAHPVLILGESGTGKELVARSIHVNGPNAAKPFIPVDCSSLVPTLVESELFGYVKGAFTGANRSKDGLLVSAEGGTVFLDEIGELPLDLQSKLLRALQEKEVRPVGATHRVPINVRILAATNRNLTEMVEQGRFRKDLYYRLNVVNLRLPALRQRREDVPLLIAHFLERKNREYGKNFRVSDEMLRILMDYEWPGNVRELEHTLDRACAYCSGTVLQLGDASSPIIEYYSNARPKIASPLPLNDTTLAAPLITPLAELEKQAILAALKELQGDKLAAAKLLGIGKTTMYRKLKEYGLGEA
jgi:DNA-binding NtrC family response regulator